MKETCIILSVIFLVFFMLALVVGGIVSGVVGVIALINGEWLKGIGFILLAMLLLGGSRVSRSNRED